MAELPSIKSAVLRCARLLKIATAAETDDDFEPDARIVLWKEACGASYDCGKIAGQMETKDG